MKGCRNCLLPREVPGSDIDATGLCAACREYRRHPTAPEEQQRRHYEADLERALQDCRGQAEYDCLVNLSGGKDSCYLVYKLTKEHGLKVLAFTTDMNVPQVAWDNIRRTIALTGVKHVVHTPDSEFYRKLYRYLLRNQEERGAVRTVCYVCAPLFEGYALAKAVELGIPLVVAGYSPGQPEPDRMVYEYPRDMLTGTDWTPPEVRASGLFSEQELALFWNPFRYSTGTKFPRYLAPFHAWEYSQAVVMKKVVELGLVSNSRHANPIHSNCPLNWLLMYSDLKHLRYNPYHPEFSKLIREGKASRMQWRIAAPMVNAMIRTKTFMGRHVKEQLEWLDLTEQELQITRPQAGAGTIIPLKPVA